MTVRAVPDWLDLNRVVPAVLRDRMRAIVDQLAALEPTLADLAADSVAVRDAYNAATQAARVPDGFTDLIGEVSGWDALFDAWMALATRACDVTECVPI
jgi:hypothetical protein